MKLILLAIASFVIEVLAYPIGAPTSSCSSMTPSHGSVAQNSASVIRVSTVKENCYTPKSPLNLQISGGSFKGFLVVAIGPGGNESPIGYFTPHNTLAATLNCNSEASAVTQKNGNKKTNVQFSWNAPADPPPQITFRLTVVRDYSTYWLSVNTTVNICQVKTERDDTLSKDSSITTTNIKLTEGNSDLTCGAAQDNISCKKIQSSNCYLEYYRKSCCNACNKLKNMYGGNSECPYGDKVKHCTKKKCRQYQYSTDICCYTCRQ